MVKKQLTKMMKNTRMIQEQIDDIYTNHLDRDASPQTVEAVMDLQSDVDSLKTGIERAQRMHRKHG